MAPLRTQAVGLLAAGLAHDLNNMLGAIVATAELVAGRQPPASADARDLAAITDQAAQAAALIRQILAFSRQEILRPAATSFGEILASLGTTLAALAGRHAALEMALGDSVPIFADRVALERVIVNLVLNARDASAANGRRARIRIETGRAGAANHPVDAPFMPAADYGWISVSDDGPGVPAAHSARIFEPYFTTRQNGQGLGLSTAYGIVKQSGGFLLLGKSRLGGACFTVYLPEGRRAPERMAAPRAAPEMPLLLFAEDETLLRLSATRALQSVGFRVLAAASGEEALHAYDRTPGISALVADIRMGGMDGVELTRRLRQRSPSLPVLLISGYADAVERDALATLDVAFLAKPFSLKDLNARIAAIL